MAVFHVDKVERSKLLNTKIVLCLKDGYFTNPTNDSSRQKSIKPTKYVRPTTSRPFINPGDDAS